MMRNTIISAIVILLYFNLCCFGEVYGQIPRSEIIDSKCHYQLKGDKIIVSGSRVIQINTRMGDNDANVNIFYNKGDKVKIGDAYIQDLSGNIIRKLKKSEIIDVSAINHYTLYSDSFVKKFELIYNQYPYQLVYSYEYERSKYLTIEAIDYSNKLQPIKNQEITLETTFDRPIKFSQKNIETPKVDTTSESIKYIWKFSYLPPKKIEISANLNSVVAPYLIILPQNFKYGVPGSLDSWESYGKWVWKLNEGRDVLPDSEKGKIDKLVEGISSPKEKARILYHYLQDNTRYVNISTKIGGVQTYPAEYVCTNRYGDCKALTNYMQAMLKHLGIKSYYTLIDSDSRITDFDISFPQDPFNHAILTLPIDSDTLFIECTSQNLAFGYVPTSNQGRKVLLIDDGNSRLVDIPTQNLDEVKCTRNFNIDINNTLVSGNLTTTQRGNNYELYKFIQNNINKNKADNYIHENILQGSYTLNNYEFIGTDRDSAYITLNTDFKIENVIKKYGNNLAVTPFAWNFPSWELPPNRTQSVQIDYPIHYVDTIVYNINSYSVKNVLEGIKIDSPYGFYSLEYKLENEQRVVVYKTFKLYAGRYDVSEYAKFHEFVIQAYNNENKNFYLEIL